MKSLNIPINKKMNIYGVVMTLLVIAELFLIYERGVLINVLLYGITIIRFLVCRYMVKSFKAEVDMGFDYGACKKNFEILSYAFAVDFVFSLIFLTYYNGHQSLPYLKVIFLFFVFITIAEFMINVFAFRNFIPTSRRGEQYYNLSIAWVTINTILVVFVLAHVRNMFFDIYVERETKGFAGLFLLILVIIRVFMKYYISNSFDNYHHSNYYSLHH